MSELHVPYEPREQFLDFHQRGRRFGALMCHRRAGKTVAAVNDVHIRALFTKKKRAKYAYIGPFRQQAKDVAWEYLKEATDHTRKGLPRESELRITLHNNAQITIYGADNPNSFRGLYFDGVILDEYADMRPSIWGEVILPTLMDREGWAIFAGTIKGKNHFWKICERARTSPDWYYKELKASTAGILTPAQLEVMKAEMDEAQYQQEMECDPNAAIPGTYYSELISQLETDGQIADYDYDDRKQVFAACDLGFSDSTAFWFWQLDPDGPVLIDYYENDGQKLEHYVSMLRNKGYDYGDVWLPHDAVSTTLQTGRSTVEQMLQAGFPCKIVPRLKVQHGIDAARKVMQGVRINRDTCYNGVEALRAYRRSWNEKTQQYSNAPMHDWASNGADAFRYFALVTEENMPERLTDDEWAPEGYCLEDLWAERENSNWRSQIIRL